MRVLLLFGDEIDRNSLIESGKYLRDSFGFQLFPFYVRDIKRSEMIPYTPDGMTVDDASALNIEQWEGFEDEEIETISSLLKARGVKEELKTEVGLVPEVVREAMKEMDLLLAGKGEMLSDNQISFLKQLYKPIILVGKKRVYFDRIMIANDDGTRVNRSCFAFMNMFPEVQDFTAVTIDVELEENHLERYLRTRGKNVQKIFITGEGEEKFRENYPQEFSLVITGNLKRSYLLEKLIKKRGVGLVENSQVSTFIG